MANKIAGYISSGIGLLGIVLSSGKINIPGLSIIPPKYLILGSVALVALGVVLLMGESRGGKIKQKTVEVPIYEGVGKKRKIVGYQKEPVK
jgi:hypothetical protein